MIPVTFRDMTARLTRAARFKERPFDTEIEPESRQTTQTWTAIWSRIVNGEEDRINAEKG